MKTLYFDARFIRLDHHDGISRFSVELIRALNSKIEVVAIICEPRQLDFLPTGIKHVMLNSPESAKEFWIAGKLNKLGAENVYSPMQVMGSFRRKYKLVLTLHDLIYYRHRKPPQDLNLLLRVLWRLYHLSYLPQRILLNRADAIVTVSKTTKELIGRHRLTRRPVSVVYNAPTPGNAVKSRKYPASKDLIYIGSFMPYKNVETLVRGVGQAEGFTLHLLSKIDSKRQSELSKLAAENNASVKFHNGVSDLEYRDLLSNAFALVTASKDEGFGIPLVEGMIQATPVVVSDLTIFREVAGDSGTFFNPEMPKQLADSLSELSREEIWLQKSQSALAQAKKFNWDNSAQELIRVFNRLETSD